MVVEGVSESGSRYLSSHLRNLRKSVDESIVRDSETTHPQINPDYTDASKGL